MAEGESCDEDDDVNSNVESAVEELELTMAVACGCPFESEEKTGWEDVEACGAPLFDNAG